MASSSIKDLDIWMDCKLDFNIHTTKLVKSLKILGLIYFHSADFNINSFKQHTIDSSYLLSKISFNVLNLRGLQITVLEPLYHRTGYGIQYSINHFLTIANEHPQLEFFNGF